MEKNNNIVNYISSDFHPLRFLPSAGETSTNSSNPKKRKRTKFIRNNPQPAKKPDPAAPKITRPCTECGRKFWSWKALFGHMRCHPERQWRGIVPPPNFRRRPETIDNGGGDGSYFTEEEHEVAAYLLMLANGPPLLCAAASENTAPEYSDNWGRFECSSCKKVFGSHQALGGHRASHKNVKGCYAITKSIDGEEYFEGCCDNQILFKQNNNSNNNGHKCCICSRIFTSGQALGGHMRCHWEKVEAEAIRVFDFDLNLAAAADENIIDDDDVSSFACSSGSTLNLRLGL